MSAVHLLKELQFSKANSFEIHGVLEEKNSKEGCEQEGHREHSPRTIIFVFKFSSPAIVQSVHLQTKRESSSAFTLASIEGNLLGDLIDYEAFIGTALCDRVKIDNSREKLVYQSKGVGEMIKFTFSFDNSHLIPEDAVKETVYKRFLDEFEQVSFFGVSSAYNIKPTLSRELLNLSLFFRKENLYLSANEVEITLALSLINENKNIQAREILAKCISFQDYCTNGIIEHLIRLKNYEFSFGSVQKILRQISRIRFRCSLLELLKSSLYKLESEVEEKVKSYENVTTLYAKSKKKERFNETPSETMREDWKCALATLYSNLLSVLGDVLHSDSPLYFKSAALDALAFGLKHQDLLTREQTIEGLRLTFSSLPILTGRKLFGWKTTSPTVQFRTLLSELRDVSQENTSISKILKDQTLEVKSDDDPYLDTKPIVISIAYNYLTNFNGMLPSLSANTLHKSLEIILANDTLFSFELPPKLLSTVSKIVEKIVVICQADLRVPVESLAILITCQTVLNNVAYRQKVEKSYSEGEEVQVSPKETLALLLQQSAPETLEELTVSFNTLWETLKTKYIFLLGVPELRNVLTHLNQRMNELMLDLQGQVLTSAFAEFEKNRNTAPIGVQELKFEKLEATGKDAPLLLSSKDMVKSKIEYLKNFRDIFGEFEYYLELIDCISANLGEKIGVMREPKEANKSQEVTLDAVSKKLVSSFMHSGLLLGNCLDSSFWEIAKETVQRVTDFLLTFLKDSVFIDYFQSSWVILCNFLSVAEEKKEEKVNSTLALLLKTLEEEFMSDGNLGNPHIVKCLFYVLEYTSKTQPLNYDKTVIDSLRRILQGLLRQVRHTQNSDLVRLIRFLLARFPDEITSQSAPGIFHIFLDKSFDLDAENGMKLVENFLDICSRKQEKDTIFATLAQLVLVTGSNVLAAKKNADIRHKILAKRKKKNAPISEKTLKQERSQEIYRKIKLLTVLFDKIESKLITELCKLKGPQKVVLVDQDIFDSDSDNALFQFLAESLEESDSNTDLLVLKLLQGVMQKVKPPSSSLGKSNLTVASFAFKLVIEMANSKNLSSEVKHELLVTSLMIFSNQLPPASFDGELEVFEETSKTRILMQEKPEAEWDSDANLATATLASRSSDVVCFDTLRSYLKIKGKLPLNDINYTNARLAEFLKLFIVIRKWVESPWSSIKGLFCNLVGFAVPCYVHILDDYLQAILKNELSTLLLALLDSRESESIINGLNIMGALCGFGNDLSKSKAQISDKQQFFRRNSHIVPIPVWEKVFFFQESWDITIQIASILILQIALPPEYGKYIYRKRKQRVKLHVETNKSMSVDPNLSRVGKSVLVHQDSSDNKEISPGTLSPMRDFEGEKQLEQLLKTLHSHKTRQSEHPIDRGNHSFAGISTDQISEDASVFDSNWLEKKFQEQELRQLLNLFKMHFSREENKWNKVTMNEKHIEILFDRNSIPQPKLVTDELERPIEISKPESVKDSILPSKQGELNQLRDTMPITSIFSGSNIGTVPPVVNKELIIISPPPEAKANSLTTNLIQTIQNISMANLANPGSNPSPASPQSPPTLVQGMTSPPRTGPVDRPNAKHTSSRAELPKSDFNHFEKHIDQIKSKTRSPHKSNDKYKVQSERDRENPVKKIIKMKNKLFEHKQSHSEDEMVELNSNINPTPKKRTKLSNISVDDTGKVRQAKIHMAINSSEKETHFKNSELRRNSSRRDVSRIISSQLAKPGGDLSMKSVLSPKNSPLDANYISNLIRQTAMTSSKPNILAKQKDKSLSGTNLQDKSSQGSLFHTEPKERPSPNRPENGISSLKRKIMSKMDGFSRAKGSGSTSSEHLQRIGAGMGLVMGVTSSKPDLRAGVRGSSRGATNSQIASQNHNED